MFSHFDDAVSYRGDFWSRVLAGLRARRLFRTNADNVVEFPKDRRLVWKEWMWLIRSGNKYLRGGSLDTALRACTKYAGMAFSVETCCSFHSSETVSFAIRYAAAKFAGVRESLRGIVDWLASSIRAKAVWTSQMPSDMWDDTVSRFILSAIGSIDSGGSGVRNLSERDFMNNYIHGERQRAQTEWRFEGRV